LPRKTGEAETLGELRSKVRKNLEENLAKRAQRSSGARNHEAIVDSNPFEVGPNLVLRQAEVKVDRCSCNWEWIRKTSGLL
jgi:FKBP-type peptidyl-prolyl cis-trans isomerase (trigger factor)